MSSDPRISFSNDFVDSNLLSHHHINPRPEPDPEASNFEFSVSNYSMMSADELFSQGKLLPYKESGRKVTTLRDELLAGEEEEERGSGYSGRPPKGSGSGSGRWREMLGLKKAHVGGRKSGRPDGTVERRMSVGYDPEPHSSKTSQERGNDGGSSRRDGDFIFRM